MATGLNSIAVFLFSVFICRVTVCVVMLVFCLQLEGQNFLFKIYAFKKQKGNPVK